MKKAKRKKKDIKVNIEPIDVGVHVYEKGFTLTFSARMAEFGRYKHVNIKCDRWWVVYIAAELQKVLQWEVGELARITQLSGIKLDAK